MSATHTAPPWWGDFLAEVRRTGKVGDSLEALNRGLSRGAHSYHTKNSPDLDRELDAAIKEGTENFKRARVLKVLEHFKTGLSIVEAVAAAGEKSVRFYQLLEETGLAPVYGALREYWDLRRDGFDPAIQWMVGNIDSDLAHLESTDVPVEKLKVAVARYGRTVQQMLAELNKSYKEMESTRGTDARNKAIRAAGKAFPKTGEGYPPFLEGGD